MVPHIPTNSTPARYAIPRYRVRVALIVLSSRRTGQRLSRRGAIGVVNLTRLTESDDLLPLALLECCKLGAGITRGLQRENSTTEYLSPEDLGRGFAAKDRLVAMNIHACLKIFASAHVAIAYPSTGQEYDTCYNPAEHRAEAPGTPLYSR